MWVMAKGKAVLPQGDGAAQNPTPSYMYLLRGQKVMAPINDTMEAKNGTNIATSVQAAT
jgi:hypothetical protein